MEENDIQNATEKLSVIQISHAGVVLTIDMFIQL